MKRKEQARAREPHPDARIEAQLQRILSIRAMIADKEALAAQTRTQIQDLQEKLARHPQWSRARYQQDQIERLLEATDALEAEILELHDQIEARLGEISDVDLTAL